MRKNRPRKTNKKILRQARRNSSATPPSSNLKYVGWWDMPREAYVTSLNKRTMVMKISHGAYKFFAAMFRPSEMMFTGGRPYLKKRNKTHQAAINYREAVLERLENYPIIPFEDEVEDSAD